ncbi:MAG: PAS domain S-box protein [Bacteroidetes bacterium]|nr:PAS domain S-box protein [Bacteroidota bacterium]
MNNLPNLLIVDDKLENLIFLESIIKKSNTNLIKALSGFEALEKTKDIELALAIIDVQMPGMNGDELAIKLNNERIDNKVPIIFLTANYFNEFEVSKGYISGAVDYIYKPIDSNILISKINVFLDLYAQKQTIIRDAVLLKEAADELKRVNASIIKSEANFRSTFDQSPVGSIMLDLDKRFIRCNSAFCNFIAYSESELIDKKISEITYPEDIEIGMKELGQLLNKEIENYSIQKRYLRKDGIIVWGEISTCIVYDENNEALYFLPIIQDISKRKQAEEELTNSLEQLHKLAEYIEKVRENERRAISRELHDDLGQALTAVKIDLGMIVRSISDNNIILKINKVTSLVSETIKTVQRLTSQLRPEIIDDLGIVAAIEWYTKDFSQRNGLEILLNLDTDISISPNISLIIFRVMQESLTNISRHSKASKVEVKLYIKSDTINLLVTDNGIGITESEIKSKKSFGIISMKERAESVGGSFNIYNEKENGTIIKLILPF